MKFKAQNKNTIKNQHFVTFIFCPTIDDLKPFLCREDNADQTWKPLKFTKLKGQFWWSVLTSMHKKGYKSSIEGAKK